MRTLKAPTIAAVPKRWRHGIQVTAHFAGPSSPNSNLVSSSFARTLSRIERRSNLSSDHDRPPTIQTPQRPIHLKRIH
uniref:Uncharacterized protein n=1 Tax=Rhodococcus sp. NS1 TaxID=402236 RepID=A0A097SQM5_9NOCA|nr:hypothetical protein LRS1606.383 [Rhodococcus sp. NS1]